MTKFYAKLCTLRQVLYRCYRYSTAKPSIVESLHFAMFTSSGHKHKHYDDVTHMSSRPLFARQASRWGGTMTVIVVSAAGLVRKQRIATVIA